MTLQRRPAPDARTFIGEGKAEEVKALAEANDASLILFDNELSPSQMSNLEELTGRTVLDRSALILDIFRAARPTGEGKLQVELAQYQYILPRLAGMGKAMSRLGGGIGTEAPARASSRATAVISAAASTSSDAISSRCVRCVRCSAASAKRPSCPWFAIVGYTNAGKSTLLNTALTGAGIEANDRLFDTLDPTTRKKRISDTRGDPAVRHGRLYPQAAASSGLGVQGNARGACYADLLLRRGCFRRGLAGAGRRKRSTRSSRSSARQDIPRLMVYNKADKCDPDVIPFFRPDEGALRSRQKTGEGVDALLAAIEGARQESTGSVCASRTTTARCSICCTGRRRSKSTDYAAEERSSRRSWTTRPAAGFPPISSTTSKKRFPDYAKERLMEKDYFVPLPTSAG